MIPDLGKSKDAGWHQRSLVPVSRLTLFCCQKLTRLHPSPVNSERRLAALHTQSSWATTRLETSTICKAQRPYSHRVKNFVIKEASKLSRFSRKMPFPIPPTLPSNDSSGAFSNKDEKWRGDMTEENIFSKRMKNCKVLKVLEGLLTSISDSCCLRDSVLCRFFVS